ncbi:nibrin [Trichoplusia ni]|uniref:Nibrin n=1 Tax=Trichoplusia ni TaxID=7111 RepID=A0A7E5VAK5_TRINI|nr:nibrin [Trichoplusia ni]
MWYLTSQNDTRIIYIVSSNQVLIGRSTDNEVCNFAIADDPSISRKHATLTAMDNGLFLQDLGSRYGTYINNSTDKVEMNTNTKLKENDIVKFGKMNSIWKVNVANLITCTSTLKGDNLQNLRLTLSKLGGILKSDWDDTCCYLTMPGITLTIKVVLALVQGSNIVTTEFWNKCLENVSNCETLPDPQDFVPEVMESTLNKEVVSFQPDNRRSSIFTGKKFIFFSRRQHEMYKTVLVKSGATPMLLSECRMTISMLCSPDVVVIQYTSTGVSQETQSQRSQMTDIVNQLKNKGKRVVADAEIGLAILFCSSNKYCNPNFSFSSEVVKQISAPQKSSKVLAQESQEPTSQQKQPNVKINESLVSEDGYDKLSVKRKLSDVITEIEVNPSKRIATCFVAEVKVESAKRGYPDDNDEFSKPPKKMAIENEKNSSEQASNDDSNMFNFVKAPTTTESEKKPKKLNLSKPQKRKLNDNQPEGNLFNFIQTDEDDVNASTVSKQSLFNNDKNKKDDSENVVQTTNLSKQEVSAQDISAMRGSKLKELMQRNLSSNSSPVNNTRRIKTEDLEDKMNKLDLCNTIVTTCSTLIKREPYKYETENTFSSNVKNFKKFKKVWPIKRQSSVIQTSSMSLITS